MNIVISKQFATLEASCATSQPKILATLQIVNRPSVAQDVTFAASVTFPVMLCV